MGMGSAEIRVNPESFQDGTEKKQSLRIFLGLHSYR